MVATPAFLMKLLNIFGSLDELYHHSNTVVNLKLPRCSCPSLDNLKLMTSYNDLAEFAGFCQSIKAR